MTTRVVKAVVSEEVHRQMKVMSALRGYTMQRAVATAIIAWCRPTDADVHVPLLRRPDEREGEPS